MRPVNLIPPEQRRGVSAPSRTGALSYIVVAALALVLIGATAMFMFDKRVDDKTAEVATLENEAAVASARAESLSAFTTFQQIHDARVATISQLATSRFDWQRVLQELSKVIPQHVWLTSLTGTVAPGVQVGGDAAGGETFRESVPGPALTLVGCGRSQDDVARLVAAMKDIDGVTRVTASDSSKPTSAAGSSGDNCQTRPTIPQFHLIAAFDEVVIGESAVPPADPGAVPAEPSTTTGADGGVADAQAQAQQTEAGVENAGAETERATNLIPGG